MLAAFSLAVGLETLPFVACAGMFYVGRWILEGRGAERPFAGFAIGLAVSAPILFGLQTAPRLWGAAECDALSAPWLVLTSGASAFGGLAIGCRPLLPSRSHRAIAALLAGTALVASFAILFPFCLQGPFAGMPEIVKTEWLAAVQEAKPVLQHFREGPGAALAIYAPLPLAAAIATHQTFAGHEPGSQRVFAILAVLLWPGAIIALFQIRGVYIGSAFIPFVAGWALDRAIARLSDRDLASLRQGVTVIASLLLLSKTWWLLALVPAKAFALVAGSADRGIEERSLEARWMTCTDPAGFRSLDRLAPGIVLAHTDLGANLLLHTHHSIIAAPYHRNVGGLLAEIEAFGGSEGDAKRHAELHQADYIVICPSWINRESRARDAFLSKLSAGETEAGWLVPLAMAEGGSLKAWRVRKP
jgi:hypothetical protein